MSATIRRNAEKIIVSTSGTITQIEAHQIRARVESMFKKTGKARLIIAHSGKLALNLANYAVWESLLACIKSEQLHSVCFIFEKENAPFRFLAQEYARRAAVPCIQRDKLEQVYA